MATVITYNANSIHAVRDHVLVKGMEFAERLTANGIIIPSDDGKSSGIKPRWAEVIAVGPKQKDIAVGEWVLVDHGRWTRGITMVVDGDEIELRRVDTNDILLVDDKYHTNESESAALSPDNNAHRIEGSMHNHTGGGLTG
jgi:co-chaperonin GroES (HSP10)